VARADQGVGAARSAQRLALALGASLLAHGALLGGLAPLPRTSNPAALLQVTLLPEAAEPHRLVPATQAARGVPPVPRYYAAHELDRRPQIMSNVEPDFPALALGPTGRVVLRLYINEAGRVDAVAVESADRTGAFDNAARDAFARAHFLPGMKGGVPVNALMRIEVLFGSPHPENAAR
jgi:TonB family protein